MDVALPLLILFAVFMAFRAWRRGKRKNVNETHRIDEYLTSSRLSHLDNRPAARSITEPITPTKAEAPSRQAPEKAIVAQISIGEAKPFDPSRAEDEFEIEYVDRFGAASKRRIIVLGWEPMGDDTMIHAWCRVAQDERHFRSSRIHGCINLRTNRRISDLGLYLRR